MKFGALLARAWNLYRTHFVLIAMITVIVWLPGDLLEGYLEKYVFGVDNFQFSFQFSNFYTCCIGIIATGGILALLEHAAIGEKLTLAQAMIQGLENWGRLWFAGLVLGVLSIAGLVLLILPGMILMVRCSLLSALVVRNRVTGMKAVRLSFA